MAFNGSRNVPDGELVERLERRGSALGPDLNASTDQKHTIYSFDIPNADTEGLDEALFLLREISSELSFAAPAIERERSVILAELRDADTLAKRRNDARLTFLTPGAYGVTRPPMGDADAVKAASRTGLTTLYRSFYRPERTLLVVAGDFDVTAMKIAIASHFADWTGQGAAGKEPHTAYALPQRSMDAAVSVNAAGGDGVAVYQLRPFAKASDTLGSRIEADLLAIATAIVQQRLTRLAESDDPPFRSAGLAVMSLADAADAAVGTAALRPGRWKQGLQALEQEWRRARLEGFSQDEVDQQLAALLQSRRNAAARENDRSTFDLAAALLASLTNDAIFATPTSALKRLEMAAPEITPVRVADVFRRQLPLEQPLIFLASSVEVPAGDVVAAWRESASRPLQPRTARAISPFAYTDFGASGQVVSDRRLADIDTRLIVFENNVRLNLKRTNFQANTVVVSYRIAGGEAVLADAPLGLVSLMKGAYVSGGLEAHSLNDLRTLFSGRAVQAVFGAGPSAFGGNVTTTPVDLLAQLQLAAAYVTHPGYRPEAELRWREDLVAAWPQWTATAQTVLAAQGMRLLASGDRRAGADPEDGVVNRSFRQLNSYIRPFLAKGAIEIAIVGDFEENAAIAAVASTFGALPTRANTWTDYQVEGGLTFRSAGEPIELRHHGEITQALTALFWPVAIDPDRDPQAVRILSALAAVLQLKVTDQVREQDGVSYAPTAAGFLSTVHPRWGYLLLGAETRPSDAATAERSLRSVVRDVQAGKVTQDELDRAMTPALEQLPAHAGMNGYWLSVIAEAQFRRDRMKQALLPEVEAGYRSITRGDVAAAARMWLTGQKTQIVRVRPVEAGETIPAGAQ